MKQMVSICDTLFKKWTECLDERPVMIETIMSYKTIFFRLVLETGLLVRTYSMKSHKNR